MKKYIFYFAFLLLIVWNKNLLAQDATKNIQDQEMQTFDSYKDVDYNQILRPQFHFTSLKNWFNDPNGMVWYEGEYHLFFQHNPKSTKWGNMTWGHAVSPDMVHWKQLKHAILPYGGGTIFSGTAIVDDHNTLGKQKGNTKTLIAVFTFAKEPFYQAAAYSTDKGRSFTLLNEGKALIPNQGFDKGERDPKIFWHKESKKWVLVLWVKQGSAPWGKRNDTSAFSLGKVRFFTSKNLTNWEVASDLDREWVFECMDFVQLKVDGNIKNKKWLIYDASFEYEIGEFDGKSFISDKVYHKGDYGTNFYASQTFNNSPDGRTVNIGWMNQGDNSIFEKAGMPFNQQMSFPSSMELKTTPEGLRLFRWPVKEIENLYTATHQLVNVSTKEVNTKLAAIKANLIDMSIEFEPKEDININLRGLDISYNKTKEMFFFGKNSFPAHLIKGKVKLRVLLDRSSIEFFANDGLVVATFYAVPELNNNTISINATVATKLNSITIHNLKSSWVVPK